MLNFAAGNGSVKPAFLITIDTEGDNLWSRPQETTTINARYLPRFQSLCERYGFKPTYLTNCEMAKSPDFQTFGRDILRRQTGEIGMHLHAWNSPPLVPLTDDDLNQHPYLIEYPEEVIHDKIRFMTDLLQETFGVEIVSHRAGRWAFNEVYARLLVEAGYRVDCSVTPHISWGQMKGDPSREGGTDYRGFPEDAYFVDLSRISNRGSSPLLEVPMTVMVAAGPTVTRIRGILFSMGVSNRVLGRLAPIIWLRPDGQNLPAMLQILRQAESTARPYVEFMLHSSELMPGGSPYFPTAGHIEKLYADLESLFQYAATRFEGATLKEYHGRITHAVADQVG